MSRDYTKADEVNIWSSGKHAVIPRRAYSEVASAIRTGADSRGSAYAPRGSEYAPYLAGGADSRGLARTRADSRGLVDTRRKPHHHLFFGNRHIIITKVVTLPTKVIGGQCST